MEKEFYYDLESHKVKDTTYDLSNPEEVQQRLEELRLKYPQIKLLSWEEVNKYQAGHLKTNPTEISEKRFLERREVLPPAKHVFYEGYESFHISEKITENLVDWYVFYKGKYWTFVEDYRLKTIDIKKKLFP